MKATKALTQSDAGRPIMAAPQRAAVKFLILVKGQLLKEQNVERRTQNAGGKSVSRCLGKVVHGSWWLDNMFLLRYFDTYILRYRLTRNPAILAAA